MTPANYTPDTSDSIACIDRLIKGDELYKVLSSNPTLPQDMGVSEEVLKSLSHKIAAENTIVKEEQFILPDNSLFDEYRIIERISKGGMGQVYKARNITLNRYEAIKVLLNKNTSSQIKNQLIEESCNLAAFKHDYVVPIYRCATYDGIPFIAMEYIEGNPLSKILSLINIRCTPASDVWKMCLNNNTKDVLSQLHNYTDIYNKEEILDRKYIKIIRDIICRIGKALDAAHKSNIVHRDIKPGNIVIRTNGDPVLVDFGLAINSTSANDIFGGTYPYMPPEQCILGKIDPRSDIYSLAATLYECITLKTPYSGSEAKIKHDILNKNILPKQPMDVVPTISKALNDFVMKGLSKSIKMRPTSSYAFYTKLNNIKVLYIPIKYDKVTASISSSTQRATDKTNMHYDSGNAYYKQGKVHEAFNEYHIAAKRNHAKAKYMLAKCYYEGIGTEVNYQCAVRLYKKSLKLELDEIRSDALCGLGKCYYYGNGIKHNYKEAVKLFKQAADNNHSEAQFRLADCYNDGDGIKHNYRKAFAYYKMAAEQGHKMAMARLSDCYLYGHGVKADLNESKIWKEKADAIILPE